MAAAFIAIDEDIANIRRRRRIFNIRTTISTFDAYLYETDIISRYRLDRNSINEVTLAVAQDIQHETNRSHALTPETQVLLALRYYAKGGFLSELADLHGVSRASASRCIASVSTSIVKRMGHLINFPVEELQKTKEDFHDIAGMPNVVGAIDGTLIPIIAPKDDEPAFVCRKQFHALNVQAVCDANLRFNNVVAKWPGSAHDSAIWNSSSLSINFENGDINGWLLGDSGYPLRPWLLTPVLRPASRAEETYNRSHKKTRNTVERAFGLLKSRFRCLHKSTGCMMFSPGKCCQVVTATCILHNLCINKGLPMPEEIDIEEEDGNHQDHVYNGPLGDGLITRRMLIQNRFS